MFEFNNNSFFSNNGQISSAPAQAPSAPVQAPTNSVQQNNTVNTPPVQNNIESPAPQNNTGAPAALNQSYAAPSPAPAPVHDSGFIEGWDDDDDLDSVSQRVNIKVFGVGGGGNNAVNRMYANGEKSATLVAVNTDIRVLRASPIESKIAIGKHTTKGHGAGANPESGRKAAEESIEYIKRNLEGVDMLYITAGMGGGTGTGASPVIAKVAKEMGILTVAVVTKPFECEGESRMATAEDGIDKLRECVDALIVVPNERLNSISSKELQISEAFEAADEILIKGVQSICRLINEDSYINLDFADLTTILKNSGDAHIGVGIASGDNKAMLAAEQAISSPLLETSIKDADGMIISIISSEKVALSAITEATNKIRKEAAPNVNLILGLKFDSNMGDNIEITVIATKSGGLRDTASVSENNSSANSKTESETFEAAATEVNPQITFDEVKPNEFIPQRQNEFIPQRQNEFFAPRQNENTVQRQNEFLNPRPVDNGFGIPGFEGKNDPLFRDEEFKLIQNIATKRNEK